jgi:uncharacterized membrane protein
VVGPAIRKPESLPGRFKSALVRPEVAFLVLGFIFGMLMLAVNPPFRIPDTILHFYKAYSISELKITPVVKPARGGMPKRSGSTGPRSFDTMERATGFRWPGGEFEVGDVGSALKVPLNPGATRFYSYGSNGRIIAPPVPYIPSAVVIDLGKLFNFSPLLMVYACGFFNLLVFLSMGYLAIRITPVLKWTFVLLGLMPTTIHLSASISEYAVDFAICFVAIAFFFRLALDPVKREVERKDIFILFVLGSLLALIKQPLFLLILLFFMIPRRKFSSTRQYWVTFAALFVFTALIALSWSLIVKGAYIPPYAKVVPHDRLVALFQNPIRYASYFFVSLGKNAWVLPDTLVGRMGNVGQVGFPAWYILTYLVVLLSVSVLDKGKITARALQKAVSIVTFLIIIIVTFLTFKIMVDVDPRNMGDWLSGRYILPVAPLFFLLFYNVRTKLKNWWYFYSFIYCFVVLTIAFTVYQLVNAYY